MNKKAMDSLSYGLYVLTARENERDNGCIINTAFQVTSRPNRIAFAVNQSNLTHDMLLRTGRCNLSVLSTDADFSIFERFGFKTGKDEDNYREGDLIRGTRARIQKIEKNHIVVDNSGRLEKAPFDPDVK